MKLLIVEDEKHYYETYTRFLNLEKDIEIIGSAENIKEFENKVREWKPDLVLLDIILHGENSLFKMRQLANELETPPFVIVVTAYGNDEYRKMALDAYIHAFLSKPIKQEELHNALNFIRKKMRSLEAPKDYFNSIYNPNRLRLQIGGSILFLDMKTFLYAKAEGNYTDLFFSDQKLKKTISMNMGKFNEELSNFTFVKRISRFKIVNLKKIFMYDNAEGNIIFDSEYNQKLQLTRTEATRVKEFLNQFHNL